MSTQLPSGDQWTLNAHDQRLVVTQWGGGIRRYTAGDRDALYGYSADAKADAGRGQVLMPWPNRIRDGKYTFAGEDQQLALTEPARGNASHGLVRWVPWTLTERTDHSLTVAYPLLPQPGWDWMLDLRITYTLTPDGLRVRPRATNVGHSPAPFGYGAHPYLTVGEERVDEIVLTLPAETVLTVDDRLVPVGARPVPPELDHTRPSPIGSTSFDDAFTDLVARDGIWRVTAELDGRSTALWAEADAFPYVQLFTGDSLPFARARTTGLAVEPMTCPANAFVTGESLVTIAPGEHWEGTWGVTAAG